MRKLCISLFLLLLFLGRSVGADKVPVQKIVFSQGVSYDGKNLPQGIQGLVAEIKKSYPQATFSGTPGELRVGLTATGPVKEVLTITWQSDCPVNSQFKVEPKIIITGLPALMERVMVAWTKARHPGFERSTVKSYWQHHGWAEVTLNEPPAKVASK